MLTEDDIAQLMARPADALDALDRVDCEESLLAFTRRMWPVLEPGRELVDGWPLEAITEHLEAVTSGQIQKLLINVPPGFMKSLLTDTFWPAWEWGPKQLAWHRYVAFSYSSSLTQRDNRRFRDVMLSQDYGRLFGGKFSLMKVGEELVSNDQTGWKLATSIGGVGTGERGDRVICLPWDQRIETDAGLIPIGQIVEQRMDVRVAGFDHATDSVVWQRIEKYETNPGGEIIEIEWDGGSVKCTGDHPVFVQGQGYTRADRVRAGDHVLAMLELPERDQAQAECTTEVLQQAVSIGASESSGARRQQPAMPHLRQDGLSDASAPRAHAGWPVLQPEVRGRGEEGREQSRLHRVARSHMRKLWEDVSQEERKNQNVFRGLWQSALAESAWCPVGSGSHVLALSGAIYRSMALIEVLLEAMQGLRARAQNERRGEWPLRARRGVEALSSWLVEHLQGQHSAPGWELLHHVRSLAGAGAQSRRAPHRLREGKSRPEQSRDTLPLVPRALARQGAVTSAVVRNVKRLAAVPRTYNLNVTEQHNYFAEGVLLHNCDDPHNVKESESDTVRQETVRWFRESMASRLNDASKSAVVVIMQRVHEEDVSGVILSELRNDYEHLCIPMDWEGQRLISTVPDMKWSEDPRQNSGELAWPNRFSAPAVRNLKTTVGPYAWAGQYQQSPTPRGGGIFKRDWWQVWDPPLDSEGRQRLPACEFVLASFDGAFGQRQENDYSALTVWGVFRNAPGVLESSTRQPRHYLEQTMSPNQGGPGAQQLVRKFTVAPRIILMQAWRKRLPLNGMEVPRLDDETDAQWRQRSMKDWGITQWVADTCRRFRVNVLLIESKANGIDVANEMQRQYAGEGWGIRMSDPGALDKVARAYSVQHLLADRMIYAPDREWSEDVITEMSVFPKTTHDDYTDTATQAWKFLRDIGLAVHGHELERDLAEQMQYKPVNSKPLYEI